jgi:hypothetical protein
VLASPRRTRSATFCTPCFADWVSFNYGQRLGDQGIGFVVLAAEEMRHAELAQRVGDTGTVAGFAPLLHRFRQRCFGVVVVAVRRIELAEQRQRGRLDPDVLGVA